MALQPLNNTNLNNYLPHIWSEEVQRAVKNSLVIAARVNRGYDRYAQNGGQRIVVPLFTNPSATAYNAKADASFTTNTETAINIDIDQRYYVAYGIDPFTKVQDAIGYLREAAMGSVYALAKQMDTSLGSLVTALSTTTTGTEGTALTETNFIAAYEGLNEQNAPFDDRSWILDPESITDVLGRDWFVSMDYVPEGVANGGFQGRSVLGAPVYISTNLPAVNTNYHAAVYMHRECFAMVTQIPPTITPATLPHRLVDDGIKCIALWGVKEMRDAFGVWIKTRS